MNMESVAGRSPYRQMHARSGELRTPADRALLSRFWRFAGRHHRRLGLFVALSVLSALLAVATPMLAGKVVDQIVGGGTPAIVVGLAAIIAVVALAEAAVSLAPRLTRLYALTIARLLLVQRATHEQLLARGGRYAELYETQFGSRKDTNDVAA